MFLKIIFGVLMIQGGVLAFKSGDDFYGQGFSVLVVVKGRAMCSATLISKFWALSACSCVRNLERSRLGIRVVDPLEPANYRLAQYKVEAVRLHPHCLDAQNNVQVENDIALLQMEEPFADSGVVFIAKVPRQLTYWTPDSQLELTFSTVADLQGRTSTIRQAIYETKIKLARPKECAGLVNSTKLLVGYAMCGGYHHKEGLQNCRLDVGSPVTYDGTLIGILSIKPEGCGSRISTALYTNIAQHSQWIREEVKRKTDYVKL